MGYLAVVSISFQPICLSDVDPANRTESVLVHITPGRFCVGNQQSMVAAHQPLNFNLLGVETISEAHQLYESVTAFRVARRMEQVDLRRHWFMVFTSCGRRNDF